MKPPTKSGGSGSGGEKKRGATIEAKPQIKNVMGDVTRFMPTALKVKRVQKDSKGRIIKTTGTVSRYRFPFVHKSLLYFLRKQVCTSPRIDAAMLISS